MCVIWDEEENPQLWLRLMQTASQTGRPEDVLAELGFDPLNTAVHRLELRLQEPAATTE
jgi:hypothetical protein